MHVVISGYYGFNNVGDEAILSSIIQALRSLEPSIRITVLSNNPPETRKTYGVEAVNRWKIGEVRRALRASDGLISGGGSLLQDETGLRSIPYYTGIMQLAKWLGKPVFVYAQGMGPINKWFNRWLTKRILQKVDGLSVRDEDSLQLLRDIGVDRDIDIVPDPVIGMDSGTYESLWYAQQNFPGKVAAVSVRDWPTESGFKERIAGALDRCVREDGISILFVPMHGKHDDETSREVAKMMTESSVVAPFDAPIEEKIALIKASDLLIGIRLHALIFAGIGCTPFLALSYDPKVDAFANIAGMPIAGHIAEDDWNADTLYSQISEFVADLSEQRKKLKQAIHPLQQQAQQTAARAIECFTRAKE